MIKSTLQNNGNRLDKNEIEIPWLLWNFENMNNNKRNIKNYY